MANKTWKYTVVVEDPEDWEKTPAKRGQLSRETEGTSVPRACSKVKKAIAEEYKMEAKFVLILDCFRTQKYQEV